MRLSKLWPLALIAALGLLAGVVSADIANSTGKLGPVLGGVSSSGSFTGGVLSSASSINNDLCFTLGTTDTSASPCLRYDTTQTADTGMLLTGTVSNHWVIAERQAETFDFAHAAQTNPTLFIHSAAQSTTQWVSLTHDGTNGVLGLGAGVLTVPNMTLGGGSFPASVANYAVGNNAVWYWGAATSVNPAIVPRTSLTPDSAILITGSASESFHIAQAGDEGFDFTNGPCGSSACSTPTLIIHSAAQDTTQWLAMSHNGTDGRLRSGLGGVYGYQQAVLANAGAAAPSIIDSQRVFTNTGDADGSTVTLPDDPTIGTIFTVTATVAQNITLAANTGETIMFGNTVCGTSFVIGGAATGIGDSVTVIAATAGSGAVWITTASAGTPVCTP
jgi:hypothetical protein